ncbi:LADA_0H03840g1_1 [Lachancea dasiensis]|uniref:LADA_0H03840g1_1 n=1 Tax=Lachancea dasiensis TaxID=1072105 RepID=A0A1G4K0L8_9SACH|nr:LADA_0H03840g1_1 [Lachancea dasiensis]
MASERFKYAETILVGKKPLESTEIIRLRLSQAKLINKEFYLLFRELSDLKRGYAQQLRKVIARNEDLEKLLLQDMLETKVLTAEELRDFRFDSLGPLKELWAGLFSDLKLDLQSSTDLYHTLDRDIITELRESAEKDPLWTQSRKLHSMLGKIATEHDTLTRSKSESWAKLQEINDQWDSQAAYLFEVFEETDYKRLLNLKNYLSKYESSISDSLTQRTHLCEKNMSRLLDFDADAEIDRFAKAASTYDFNFEVPALPSPTDTSSSISQNPQTPSDARTKQLKATKSGSGSLSGLTNRLSSSATVVKHDLMKSEFSSSANNDSLNPKKSPNKLKSKMGSIFGRKKLKNKKSGKLQDHPIAEDENSSIRTDDSPAIANGTPSKSSDQQPHRSREGLQRGDSGSFARSQKPKISSTTSSLSINQPSLKPQPRKKSSANEIPKSNTDLSVSENTDGAVPAAVSTAPTSGTSSDVPKTSQPIHIQAPQVPVPPPSRKTGPIMAPNVPRESHGSVPAPASTTRRSDIQSKLFTDLSHADIDPQYQKRQSSISSQMTGELRILNPQTTGSSLSVPTVSGQSIFHHSELTSFGLNASIAEVISATFKEGLLTSSQLIGEIALNFVADSEELPIDIRLRMNNFRNVERVIVNQAFIEQIEPEIYKVNPQFIENKTLGAFKYALSDPIAPIAVHPVWRFEDHQASVALTLSIAPTIDESIEEIVVEDLIVFVSIEGATATSALSKPQGSFSKEKRRITWRFKEPLLLRRGGDERLIARFLTDGRALESAKGVGAKFTLRNYHLGSALELEGQQVEVADPFAANASWRPVTAKRTLVAGNYLGLSQ